MAKKQVYDKALTRLVSILSKLYNGDSLSVKELAIEFNVSTRTIQRDLNERLISFPVYQDKRLWKMQDGFRLEKSNSVEDTIVLDIMEKLVEGVGNKFSSKAKALLSKIKNEEFSPIYAKLNLEDIGDKLDVVQFLESAIKSKQEIKCLYKIKKAKVIDLNIKPLNIANFEGFWYLIALDTNDKDTVKKYYLKNISKIKILEETFTVEAKIEELLTNAISVWFNAKQEPFEVKLNASNEIAKYLTRKPISPTQMIESVYEDGSIDIVIKITSKMEIMPLVKYWLPYMKVLEPVSIREEIKQELIWYLNDL